jgi:putative colanic acid biosynthesis acetyltransferase WcaF
MPVPNTADSDSSRVRLDRFDSRRGLDRGRSKVFESLWYLCKCVFFLSALPWPKGLKRGLLRAFGAEVGRGVVIKPRVNIHFPWKLELGDHCWVGEECFILNFEPVSIGAHACLSQRSMLCGGNHDFRSPDFVYRNGPIRIERGAWVGAQVFVGPGVTIHEYAVATAGSVVSSDLPPNRICTGAPCRPVRERFRDAPPANIPPER